MTSFSARLFAERVPVFALPERQRVGAEHRITRTGTKRATLSETSSRRAVSLWTQQWAAKGASFTPNTSEADAAASPSQRSSATESRRQFGLTGTSRRAEMKRCTSASCPFAEAGGTSRARARQADGQSRRVYL